MSLEEWLEDGFLKKAESNPEEIGYLLETIANDFKDSMNTKLSIDWQFKIAYNSILNCGIVALAAEGYRPSNDSHHYWTIQSLALTLKVDRDIVDLLDDFRKKRNRSSYERTGIITKREADEIIELSRKIQSILLEWLKKNHSDLISG
jgi:hypothetical protein